MTRSVDFYFDFGSPASYLAATQLPQLCADAGAALVWKPMLLGGVFQATGNQSPATSPAKGPYVFEDLARFARRYGVPLRHNPYFPVNTLLLMRGAIGMQMREPERLRPMSTPSSTRCGSSRATSTTWPRWPRRWTRRASMPAAMLALASAQEVKDRLKAETEEAVRRGVFGAPTMFVGDQMFWGQDRLDFVREALGLNFSNLCSKDSP